MPHAVTDTLQYLEGHGKVSERNTLVGVGLENQMDTLGQALRHAGHIGRELVDG